MKLVFGAFHNRMLYYSCSFKWASTDKMV